MARGGRAPMPKDQPQEGEAFIVFSVLNSKGVRMEFTGKVSQACAAQMMSLAQTKRSIEAGECAGSGRILV